MRSVRQTHAEASADLGCLPALQKKKKKPDKSYGKENLNKRGERGQSLGLADNNARVEATVLDLMELTVRFFMRGSV